MTDIVFLDTETLGLHPDAPIWEFAAINRPEGDPARTHMIETFTIQHDPGDWLDTLDEQFTVDYHARYNPNTAHTELAAALAIDSITRDAVVIGCNPSFDLQRLEPLLRRNQIEPRWHYRPICVTTMAATGLIAAKLAGARGWIGNGDQFAAYCDDLLTLPWSSDRLSRAIDVKPDDYQRHTAMGDVRWVQAQWDAITGVTR